MKYTKYPDGATYFEATYFERDPSVISYIDSINGVDFKVNSYQDLWYLNQYTDANPGCKIVIPNLIDAQADRRFNSFESFGLKLVTDLLNRMPAKFTVFHPHNAAVLEALMPTIEIRSNKKFIQKVLEDYKEKTGKKPEESLILMSADAGGFKPLVELCTKIGWKGEIYSASKARDPVHGGLTQQVDREDFGDKDILIVDDLAVYGGTFKGLSTLLKNRNVGKIYLAVSHMTVQNLGEDPLFKYFDYVYTTNSKFDEYFAVYGVEELHHPPIQPPNLIVFKMFNPINKELE